MSPLPPIYREHGKAFRADTCRPVAKAVADGKIGYAALVRGHYPGRKLPATALPGLRNLGFWSIESPQGWGLGWHRNEGVEITFLENGRLDFAVTTIPVDLKNTLRALGGRVTAYTHAFLNRGTAGRMYPVQADATVASDVVAPSWP